jgi:hypothetical protein
LQNWSKPFNIKEYKAVEAVFGFHTGRSSL